MFEPVTHGISPWQLLGMASALLSCYAFFPYIRDTLAERTRPQRASWLIWSTLGSVALCSQIYEGAVQSLWFAATQVGGTVLIFLLSITRGTGRCLQGGDCWVLVLAGIGLALWSITENAGYALAITIAISLIGGSVTVTKALRDPSSETMATWVCSLLAAVLAMLSVGRVDWVLLAYPFYLFALSGAIVVAMIRGRERQLQVGYPTLQ